MSYSMSSLNSTPVHFKVGQNHHIVSTAIRQDLTAQESCKKDFLEFTLQSMTGQHNVVPSETGVI